VSNVIRFLESMGRQPMPSQGYAASVAALDVQAAQQRALLDRDQVALNAMLGGRSQVFFGVLAPVEDEEDLEALAA